MISKFEGEVLSNLPNILPNKIAVAVSGGCDSMALTFLLQDFCLKNKIDLFAISIDHRIREGSSQELIDLSKILSRHQVNHQILAIEKKSIPKSNIEARLRDLRYELLSKFCQENQIQFLFLGHHLGDVAENFIIRLFRGSGLDGLSTMAKNQQLNGVSIIRPLLDFGKKDLQIYLQSREIKWFEDESNDDTKFLRNKIRKFLGEFEDQDLIAKRIKSTSDSILEIKNQFDDLLIRVAKSSLRYNINRNYFIVNKDLFANADELTILKIIALILMEIGGKDYKPRSQKLRNFYLHIKANNFKNINFYGAMAFTIDQDHLAIFAEKDKDLFLKLKHKERYKLLDQVNESERKRGKLKTILDQIL